MSIFAISDLHLSLSADKPMDVFCGWDNYVDKIEKNWRKVVSDDDFVVIAGDISWALKLEQTYADMKFLNDLPGTKILVKGNHDFWWNTKAKVEKYFFENGFHSLKLLFNNSFEVHNEAICGSRGWLADCKEDFDKKILNRELGRVERSIQSGLKIKKNPIVFLHYPPIYDSFECEEMIQLLNKYNIKNCYYGHIHGKNSTSKAVNGNYYGINFKLISCDSLDFRPIVIK
ncbi:MAG: metallophosphoesterase [Clostridia bacterium]|nr:metallophosphoesterase [Clostridia bacterium]